jgi:hypothetical protein
VLRLPGFTRFLQVLHQDFAALRSSSSPERCSYTQKPDGDAEFLSRQGGIGKFLNLKEKIFYDLGELLSALS